MFRQFSRELALHYQAVKLIHEGSNGLIYQATEKENGKSVAVKILHRQASYENFLQEIKVLKQLQHPNIITLYTSKSKDPQKSFPYYVIDYYQQGSLQDQNYFHFSIEDKIRILMDVSSALECIHQQNLIHRCIHPSNIFLKEDGCAVLGDFRLIGKNHTQSDVILGCKHYIAPEHFLRESKLYLYTSDIYSLGVLVFQMFTPKKLATELFYDMSKTKRILNKELKQLSPNTSKAILELLLETIDRDPQKRFQSVYGFKQKLEKISMLKNEAVKN